MANSPDELEYYSDEGLYRPRVPSNALRFDQDLSLFWCEHLVDTHQGDAHELANERQKLVFEILQRKLLDLSLRVEHTPQATVVPGCAHCSAWMPAGSQTKAERRVICSAIARSSQLVGGECTLGPPEGA